MTSWRLLKSLYSEKQQRMSDYGDWQSGIEGNFALHKAVVGGKIPPEFLSLYELTVPALPKGTTVISAESCGVSAWTRTAKVSVVLPDGTAKRYFLKVRIPGLLEISPDQC